MDSLIKSCNVIYKTAYKNSIILFTCHLILDNLGKKIVDSKILSNLSIRYLLYNLASTCPMYLRPEANIYSKYCLYLLYIMIHSLCSVSGKKLG